MALLKGAIQREGVRYHPSLFAQVPEEIGEVWEGRHKFDAVEQLAAGVPLMRLDKNAAYLSAANTALPIGRLVPDDPPVRAGAGRAGMHLINYTPGVAYPHGSPLGNREEFGSIWITTPTMKLLDEVHQRLGVPPILVVSSMTAEATEVLLRPWIAALRDLRMQALADGNRPLYEFVKSCYSKTISTMGASNANWEIRRPDWMKIIRAQAYANLYRAALKIPERWFEGELRSPVVHMGNIDELWLRGDSPGTVSVQYAPLVLGQGLGQWKIKKTWVHGEDEA